MQLLLETHEVSILLFFTSCIRTLEYHSGTLEKHSLIFTLGVALYVRFYCWSFQCRCQTLKQSEMLVYAIVWTLGLFKCTFGSNCNKMRCLPSKKKLEFLIPAGGICMLHVTHPDYLGHRNFLVSRRCAVGAAAPVIMTLLQHNLLTVLSHSVLYILHHHKAFIDTLHDICGEL